MLRVTLFLLGVVALFQGGVIRAAEPRFQVVAETESPNGRYALAWGMPSVSKSDWEKLLATPEDASDPDFPDPDKVENYIVDVKSRRILSTIPFEYWSLPAGWHANRLTLDATWASDSRTVVVLASGRFEFALFGAWRIEGGNATAHTDLGPGITKAVRGYFARTQAADYRRLKDEISIPLDSVRFTGGGKFSVSASACVPKGDCLGDVTIHFALQDTKAGLKFSVTKVSEKEEEAPSPEHDLAEADRHLNRAYAQLRAKLDDARKEELKQEQKTWLAERDKIEDGWQRSRFVETRANELEARAGVRKH